MRNPESKKEPYAESKESPWITVHGSKKIAALKLSHLIESKPEVWHQVIRILLKHEKITKTRLPQGRHYIARDEAQTRTKRLWQ